MIQFTEEKYSRRSVLCAAMGVAVGLPRFLSAQQTDGRDAHPAPAATHDNSSGERPGADRGPTAHTAGAREDASGTKGNLRVAIIPAGEPFRPADEVFRTSAGMGFEAVQCHMGVHDGWLQSHRPTGPETGPWLAKRIASCCPRGAQFYLDPGHLEETVRAIEALRSEHDLEIACLYTGFQAHWLDVLVPVAACAQAIGCKAIKLDASSASADRGTVFGHCANYREWLDVSRGRLREALTVLRPYDVRLIFETHPWVITRNAQSCYRLVDGFDPKQVGILLDVANFWFEGNEPIEVAVDLLRDYIAQIHVKNVAVEVKREAGHGGAVVTNVRLADGVVDWPSVLRVLKSADFAGDAAIECFAASILGRNDRQAVDELVRSEKDVFCRWAEQAGMWSPTRNRCQ
jgi:sugar phosphate isomerase/epimerase